MNEADTELPNSDLAIERNALARCQRGEKRAFGVIVERYKKRAYFCALGIVGRSDDALDISQDAFIRAFQSIAAYDIERPFFNWYYSILRNLCLNLIRDNARFDRLERVADRDDDCADDPSVLMERTELNEKLWTAISRLSNNDREILTLKEFENLSYKQIAALLDLPIGTVMSRLYHARRRLKEEFERITR